MTSYTVQYRVLHDQLQVRPRQAGDRVDGAPHNQRSRGRSLHTHTQSPVGTYMHTQRAKQAHTCTHREPNRHIHAHIESPAGTFMRM